MVTQKMGKNGKNHICVRCAFETQYKSNYNEHLMTAKHKMIINDNKKMGENGTQHSCECDKSYKFASGLSRHKIKCSFIHKTKQTEMNTDNIIINSSNNKEQAFLELMSKNNDLMEMLQEQSRMLQEQHKTINEMIPKIGNNNTTTNHNNQFNLQVFLNEDCKDAINFSEFIKQIHVSFEDLENQVESGYVKGISKLFIESLQGLGTNKRPIHCTDKKRKTLYIKENDAWDKEGSQDMLANGINEVTRRTMQTLMKEKETNSEEYADMDSEFSMKCLDIQKNLFPSAPRETTIRKVIENITQNSGIIE
jgi:hypothetical protein